MNALLPVGSGQSPWRAWLALVGLSLRRQARARQMIWVALGLLLIAIVMVGIRTARGGWSSANSRYQFRALGKRDRPPPSTGPVVLSVTTYGRVVETVGALPAFAPAAPEAEVVMTAVAGALRATLDRTSVVNFTRAMMFSLFIGFLLPIWCLSFATEPLGGERESRSLVWLLTRPMPRWAIYFGKYLALLPWALGFTVGGFCLLCLAAGPAGKELFPRYWPAVAAGTFAFTSLFHLISAAARRPTVIGLVYCFFLETMLGDMPGLMKRISVSFYVRCLLFDAAESYGIQPDKPSVYLPVDGSTAWIVLATITTLALIAGAWIFSRAEYRDDGS